MKTFKTPKGTELPLMDLKGKDYLQVAHRVRWFREENQYGKIDTERISESDKHVTYRATISVYANNSEASMVKLANADKTVNIKQPTDYEKCETAAIGRALALCGYGTQFTDDLEEGEQLADAPLNNKATNETMVGLLRIDENHGPLTFDVGKHKGRSFEAVLEEDVSHNYAYWVKNQYDTNLGKLHPTLKEFYEYCNIQGVYNGGKHE